jgi:hypothetical protein
MRKLVIVMNRNIHLVILFFISSNLFSQTIPYQKLDSLCSIINILQNKTNGDTIKEESGHKFQISYPDENFKVFAYNHLATYAVYKKYENKEVLELTENVDLSKAISFKSVFGNYYCTKFRMEFPVGTIKTETYEKGTLIRTSNNSFLDFYFHFDQGQRVNKTSEYSSRIFYNNIIKLLYLLKAEKGTIHQYDMEKVSKNWNLAVDKFSSISFKAFLSQYPGTLYTPECNRLIERTEKNEKESREKKEKKELQQTLDFFEKVKKVFSIEIGIDIENYKAKYPDVAKEIIKIKYRTKQVSGHISYTKEFYIKTGVYELVFLYDKLNSGYYHQIYNSIDDAMTSYNEIRKYVSNNIAKKYIKLDSEDFIKILHPTEGYKLTICNCAYPQKYIDKGKMIRYSFDATN